MVPRQADQTAFVPDLLKLLKAITLFCLTPYPDEIEHSNSPNRELYNGILDVVVRRREVALHTISPLRQLKRDEALFPPLRRVVVF